MSHHKKRIKKEFQRAIIIFADIWGFGKWSRRVNPKEYRILSDQYDLEIDSYKSKNECFFKYLGDGFLAVYPMHVRKNGDKICEIIRDLQFHYDSVKKIIDNYPYYPRPNGYRVRMSMGHVWYRSGPHPDYSGYFINMTSHLLSVDKDVPFIVHQSLKEAIPPKQIEKSELYFRKHQPPSFYSDGIDQDDINNLWSLEFDV